MPHLDLEVLGAMGIHAGEGDELALSLGFPFSSPSLQALAKLPHYDLASSLVN